MNDNKDTFIKITNADIYSIIQENQKANNTAHNEIIRRLDITNGKVKSNKWMITTAMTLIAIILGVLFTHLGKG